MAGGVAANNIARWDGKEWTQLGTGIARNHPQLYQAVHALAIWRSSLYVGGQWYKDTHNIQKLHVARWDGRLWHPLGGGLNNIVHALAAAEDGLYAGGRFAEGVAKWNGNEWAPLGKGVSISYGSAIYALAVSGNDLFVGGSYFMPGDLAGNYIAKWDGITWSALGSGLSLRGAVDALTVSGNDLYVGGGFAFLGRNQIAKWTIGSTGDEGWSALGTGVRRSLKTGENESVYAIAIVGNDLYAGGNFTISGNLKTSS